MINEIDQEISKIKNSGIIDADSLIWKKVANGVLDKNFFEEFGIDKYKIHKITTSKEIHTLGKDVLSNYYNLVEVNLLNVSKVCEYSLRYNFNLKMLNAPKLKHIEHETFRDNYSLEVLSLPNLVTIDFDTLRYNYALKKLNLPK